MSSLHPPDSENQIVQARLAAIVESSDDAIISKDLHGIIQTWNRGAEKIFGYTAEEAVGQHICLIAPPDRVDEIAEILRRISRGERVEHYETRRRTKDGRTLIMSLTVSPIRNAAGEIVGASKIGRDITERVLSRQALHEANRALTRSNADLEQFAYSASHDLQEPLRMVATYSELLQRRFAGQLGAGGEEYIRYIVDGASRMDQLLKDLRAFVYASAGQDPDSEIDSGKALRQAMSALRLAIQENGATIEFGNLPCIRMHEFQLQQLFQNLIANAIRFRSEEPPRIYVGAERCQHEWRFAVRDNGIGIDSKYKEQIFGIFKRLHSAADFPGTGMGLAICQRIVERNGGRIWVESDPGRGSTFFFTLPSGGSD